MARRRLVGGIPRLLPDHRTRAARVYREHLAMLAQQYTIDTEFKLDAAGRVALARVLRDAAVKALLEAQHQRATGRGRKPSAREVERLAKRQGLQAADYERALDRLERVCGGPASRASGDLAKLIQAGLWPDPRRQNDDGSEED